VLETEGLGRMNPLNDERLKLNQKFIDLIDEYESNTIMADHHSKGLFKYIWNQGYMLVPKDSSIY
jgi:hypothetical protein